MELQDTNVIIQFANCSFIHPKGVVKDVLVTIDKLVFPDDFYVVDMVGEKHATPIILGRGFMKTARTKIDVYTGSLTMEFEGNIIKHNITKFLRQPP